MEQGGVVKLYLPAFKWWYRGGHFNVLVDGVVIGDVWQRRVKVLDVAPGRHQIQLRFWPIMWSRKFEFSVRAGEALELACSPGWTWFPGAKDIHKASDHESDLMRKSMEEVLPPRNLGAEPDSA